jgi:hypothetical protein
VYREADNIFDYRHFSGEEDFNSMPTPPGAATPESEVKEGIEAVDSTAKL